MSDATTMQTAIRNYKDIFSFKKFALDTLAKKYFPDQDVSTLNIGMIGYASELIGTGVEDSFFTVSTLIKEMFPNKAQLPESIYSYAAMFQLSNAFAKASECKFLMVFEEDMIRGTMETVNAQEGKAINRIYLDKDTQIVVEDIPFVLDYDIEITMKEIRGETVYSAKYVTVPFKNCVSNIANPYIKVRKSIDNYLALEVIGHQCYRDEEVHQIINNSKINHPTIDIPIYGKLAGFDILYKEPGEDEYNTQLVTRVVDSTALMTPFCYYRMRDENTLQISFSTMDNYFQPKFNSEVKITLYTTNGSDGKFETYIGNNIDVICTSERYWYNESMVLGAKAVSGSVGGTENLPLEDLQNLVVEMFSTANALTTDADLEFFFYNYQYRYNNNIKFIKRRDDVCERLFAGYLIMRDDRYIYPTNTLDIAINYLDMYNPTNGFLYTLDPGAVFTYEVDKIDRVTPIKTKKHDHMEEAYYRWCLKLNPDSEYGIPYKKHPFHEWRYKFIFLEEYYDQHKNDVIIHEDVEFPVTLEMKFPDRELFIEHVLNGLIPDYHTDDTFDFPYDEYNRWDNSHVSDILTIFDDEYMEMIEEHPQGFYFSNPFLLALTTRPNIFGYYLTVVDKYALLDFTNYNPDSFLQFILNQVHVTRKLAREKRYDFSVALLPSVKWNAEELIPSFFGVDVTLDDGTVEHVYPSYKENPLRVIMTFQDKKEQDACYIELIPTSTDTEDQVTFTGCLYTDDHLTASGCFRVVQHPNAETPVVFMSNQEGQLLPMENVVINIYTLYREPDTEYTRVTNNNFVQYDSTLLEYSWTNVFNTYSDPVTFIKPLNMIRSSVYFRDDRAINVNTGDVYVYSSPFLRSTVMTHKKITGEPNTEMEQKFYTFINQYLMQYTNLETVLDSILRNTSHIDLKFYNTFGKGKNYLIGETDARIDRVNISFYMDVYVGIGTDMVAKKLELQNFIKDTVERINQDGSNELYVSNIIRKVENNFGYVEHLKFKGINEYDTEIQSVVNNTDDINELSKEERFKYVPEMLVCNIDDIHLRMIEAD